MCVRGFYLSFFSPRIQDLRRPRRSRSCSIDESRQPCVFFFSKEAKGCKWTARECKFSHNQDDYEYWQDKKGQTTFLFTEPANSILPQDENFLVHFGYICFSLKRKLSFVKILLLKKIYIVSLKI